MGVRVCVWVYACVCGCMRVCVCVCACADACACGRTFVCMYVSGWVGVTVLDMWGGVVQCGCSSPSGAMDSALDF